VLGVRTERDESAGFFVPGDRNGSQYAPKATTAIRR
jgi:hypothetical protein